VSNLIGLIEIVTEDKIQVYSALLNELEKQPFCFYFLIVFIEQFYQSNVVKGDEIEEFIYYLKNAHENVKNYDLELFIKNQTSNVRALVDLG